MVNIPLSPVRFLGYHKWEYPQAEALDCIFVQQNLYAIIDMHDIHNNIVLTNDTASWYEYFTFEL